MPIAPSPILNSERPSGARSPEYIQLSLASALALRLRSGRFYRDARPKCINLLLTYPDGCRANCAYCGLARERRGAVADKSFIRVEWPVAPTEEVVGRIARYRGEGEAPRASERSRAKTGHGTARGSAPFACQAAGIARVCLSMVLHPRAWPDTVAVIEQLRDRIPEIPLSVLVAPNLASGERLARLRDLGVDRLGIGLDAADERIFQRRRGRHVRGGLEWELYWRRLENAREVFGPHRVNCHLVVGLGETDSELVETYRRLLDLEIAPYLFSFYPEPGGEAPPARLAARSSPLAAASSALRAASCGSRGSSHRPSLLRWRRLQLVGHLLACGEIGPEALEFDGRGRLRRIRVSPDVVENALAQGDAFMTHGCPGPDGQLACNRPFGSYRPGEPFRDYPFRPDATDLQRVERQLRLKDVLA